MSRIEKFFRDTQSAVRVALDEELSKQRDATIEAIDNYFKELQDKVPDEFNPEDEEDESEDQDMDYDKFLDIQNSLEKIKGSVYNTEDLAKILVDNDDAEFEMISDIHEAVTKDSVQDKVEEAPENKPKNDLEKPDADNNDTANEETETNADASEQESEVNAKQSTGQKIVNGLKGINKGIGKAFGNVGKAYGSIVGTIESFFNRWWQWVPELFLLINIGILLLRKMWYELKIQLGIAVDKTHQWLNNKMDNWAARALGLAPDKEEDKKNLTDEEYIKAYGVSKDGKITYDQYVEQLKQKRDEQRIDKINEMRRKRGEPLVDENGDTIEGSETPTEDTPTVSNSNSAQSSTNKVEEPSTQEPSTPNTSVPSVSVDDLYESTKNKTEGDVSMSSSSSVTVNNTNINVYPHESFIDYV